MEAVHGGCRAASQPHCTLIASNGQWGSLGALFSPPHMILLWQHSAHSALTWCSWILLKSCAPLGKGESRRNHLSRLEKPGGIVFAWFLELQESCALFRSAKGWYRCQYVAYNLLFLSPAVHCSSPGLLQNRLGSGFYSEPHFLRVSINRSIIPSRIFSAENMKTEIASRKHISALYLGKNNLILTGGILDTDLYF